jgi:prepilin-type processing-associated H-X9-DG protein
MALGLQMYWDDNAGKSFRYLQVKPDPTGQTYWFGWIANGQDGKRAFDLSTGSLYPYFNGTDVRLCPSPIWMSPQFKPKGTNVIFSYACNGYIFGGPGGHLASQQSIQSPANTATFSDAAQSDPFNPGFFQEWYYFDLETRYGQPGNYPNSHFRHEHQADVSFADGHIQNEKMVAGSLDARIPNINIGQLRPEVIQP